MTKETDNKNSNRALSLDELIDDMQNGNYKHIQVFVYKDEPINNFGRDEKFLVVNNKGLGLYSLNSIDYCDGKIQLVFTDPTTGNPVTANLNIRHTKSDLFIIDRKDIADLVYNEQTNAIDELF